MIGCPLHSLDSLLEVFKSNVCLFIVCVDEGDDPCLLLSQLLFEDRKGPLPEQENAHISRNGVHSDVGKGESSLAKGDLLETVLKEVDDLGGFPDQIDELSVFEEIGSVDGKGKGFLGADCLNFEDVCAVECEADLKAVFLAFEAPWQ